MADDPKISTAGSVKDWVEAYYGDDAFDISKAKKIGHIYHTAQFSACCYVISKASKKAHADLFDSNYAAVDTTYARIAEMCIKLLEIKFRKNRELTKDDFIDCGWENIFDKKKLDEYFEDYVGPAGILDRCQSCFPIIKDKVMGDDGEEHEVVNYKRTADGFKAVKDDFEDVRKDHTYLLTLTGAKDSGILSRENVFKLFDSTTDAASKTWKEKKSEKSTGEKALLKLNEEMFHSRYELVKSTTKNAVVAGAAVMSLGAVISGVFWPAILLIPEYSLLKKNMPDMFKSLGKYWGQIEKKFKTKRDIKRADAAQKYIVSFAETNGKPKLPFKVRRYLRKSDITILKKQAKVVRAGLSLEWSDEKKHDSELEIAKKALFNSRFYSQSNSDIMKKDELAPIDLESVLDEELKNINPKTVTYGEMVSIASDMKEFAPKLPNSAGSALLNKYADILRASAKHLIFETPLQSTDDYEMVLKSYFGDDSLILSVAKDSENGKDLPLQIKKYVDFASGEQSKLSAAYVGKTLEDYINRVVQEPQNEIYSLTSPEIDSLYKSTTPAVKEILEDIVNLEISSKDETAFIVKGTDVGVDDIVQKIGKITGDDRAKARCNKLLNDQMKRVAYQFDRANSKKTYESITGKGIKGSMTVSDALKKIGEMKFENIETFNDEFYVKSTKFEPADVGSYVRSKAAKKIVDIMTGYANQNQSKFSTDLNLLTDYLKKVNQSIFLNEYQKITLSERATGCISKALDKSITKVADNFVKEFNSKTYSDLSKDHYEEHGLYEFLNGSQAESEDAQKVYQKLGYLQKLGTIKENLQFGKNYKMSDKDEANIGKILLLDEEKDFGEVKERKDNDELLAFFRVSLMESKAYASFEGKSPEEVIKEITKQGQGYSFEKMQFCIDGVSNNVDMSVFDKFAALTSLKYKALADMKQCLEGIYILCGNMSEFNEWLKREDQGKKYYDSIVVLWEQEIMTKIDEALANTNAEAQSLSDNKKKELFNKLVSGNSASSLIRKYKTSPSKGLIEENQLGM